ncbi:MAG: DNA repair protein RadC [Clostridia bacterium]|nr:DNA repair protein RadC [Clostridia bacterium]
MATKDVKHDGHRDRMRERILTSGISSLQSHEILEYLLYAFIPRKNTNDIAHALIEKFGSLSGVLNADAKALLEVDGMTKNAAIFLATLPEISRAYLKEINTNKMSLSGRGVVREFLGSKLYGLPYEQVVAVALDSKDGFIALEKIAKGDGSSVKIEVREIVDFALKHNAVNIVLAHNHPSGQTSPSQADVDLTAEVAYTLGTIGVNLEDHLIFCGSKFYSFADSGRLSKIAAVNQTLTKTFKEGITLYD